MSEKVWDKIFIEVCGNAVASLKNDFANWVISSSAGKDIHTIIDQFKNAYGTELALETTVTSYISIEFAKSALTKGFIHNNDKEKRFYELLREVTIKKSDGRKKILDFVINRIDPLANPIQIKNIPALIEAKRFRRWKISSDEIVYPTENWKAVEQDIYHLMEICTHPSDWHIPIYKDNHFRNYFPHVLIWDIVDADMEEDLKLFYKNVKDKTGKILTKWIPFDSFFSTDFNFPHLHKPTYFLFP